LRAFADGRFPVVHESQSGREPEHWIEQHDFTKKFKLASHEIKPIFGAMGGCVATDRITVEGYPVRFMYREEPDNEYDSYSCSW